MKPHRFHSPVQSGTNHTARSTLAAMYASPLPRYDVAMKLVGLRHKGEPKCMQWACRQSVDVVKRQVSSWNAFAQVIKNFTRSNHRTNVGNKSAAKCHDAATWPKHWSAGDIEHFLRDKIASGIAAPNYNSFAMLLKLNDINSLNTLLRECVVAPSASGVDVTAYLAQHLSDDSACRKEFGRNDCLLAKPSIIANSLRNVDRALSPKFGSEKRNIVCSASSSDNNTWLLTCFVSIKRAPAMRCGRVIVRCCRKSRSIVRPSPKHHAPPHHPSWIDRVLEDEKGATNRPDKIQSINEGLCDLIRMHVAAVTGMWQDPSKYCDPCTAYATWISETAWFFAIDEGMRNMDPLIILDSCEILSERAHKTYVHTTSGKPYSMLEAFCLAVPSPYSILAVGCDVKIDTTDPVMLAIANVAHIGLLPHATSSSLQAAITATSTLPQMMDNKTQNTSSSLTGSHDTRNWHTVFPYHYHHHHREDDVREIESGIVIRVHRKQPLQVMFEWRMCFPCAPVTKGEALANNSSESFAKVRDSLKQQMLGEATHTAVLHLTKEHGGEIYYAHCEKHVTTIDDSSTLAAYGSAEIVGRWVDVGRTERNHRSFETSLRYGGAQERGELMPQLLPWQDGGHVRMIGPAARDMENILDRFFQESEDAMIAQIPEQPGTYPLDDPPQRLEVFYLARDDDGNCYPIYVHSKIVIMDDAVCVIGSANINDRSLMSRDTTTMGRDLRDCKPNPRRTVYTDVKSHVVGRLPKCSSYIDARRRAALLRKCKPTTFARKKR